jgi:2-dehydro-3-deoxygluconokinase
MTRIVAIGECMVELAPAGPAGVYSMGFAGDTMNTAWYLSRLLGDKARVDYLSAVGSDTLSGQMVDFLAGSGIGTAHVARASDRTVGLYMIQLQDGERSFSYWRGQSAARTLARDADALDAALDGADIAYASGITLAILPEEDRARLLAALARVRQAGGIVVFDPNLRPRLWDSPAQMTAAISEAAAISDICLPSFEDEAQWFHDADPAATADRYARLGVRTVVVKNGPGRILALENGAVSLHEATPVARIVDTTAAGDAFNAGYLAARTQDQPLTGAIRAAADLAARVVGARGALVPDATL